MAEPVVLPLDRVLGRHDDPPENSVDWWMTQPGVQSDCCAVPTIKRKCIMCCELAIGAVQTSNKCKCNEATYHSKTCREDDVRLHKLLCSQAADFKIVDQDPEKRVRVMILHAKQIKADFAWAAVTDAGLEMDHPALNDFKLAQKDLFIPDPELVNTQLRKFKETKYLGHCVLVWTACNWKKLPIDWVNRTAMFMGGKPGHTVLFYGPLVVTVLKQDMVIQKKRTPDHVQMRTLRQVADYIEMTSDNPCVPWPQSYKPEFELQLIPAVKINDGYELGVMGTFGMTARREEVHVSVSHTELAQGIVAAPLVLGLRWYVRYVMLDIIIDRAVADRDEQDLVWTQWGLQVLADSSGQKKAHARKCPYFRSIVLFHAGGARLRIEHVDALTEYLHRNQITSKDRAGMSKNGFATYWQENYGSLDIPSPYDLEASHPTNLFEHDADTIQAFAAAVADTELKKKVLHFYAVRAESLLRRLVEAYQDEQVVKIVEAMTLHCLDGKSIENLQAAAETVQESSNDMIEAIRVVEQLANMHTELELRGMTKFINKFEER